MTEETATQVAPASAPPGREPVMRSPVHALHTSLGARFDLVAGWEIPAAYGDGEEGHLQTVAICDITAHGKIDIRGSVDPVLGGGVSGGVTARISDSWALVLTSPENTTALLAELESRAGAAAMVTDATHLYAGFALAGPAVPDLFAQVTGFDTATVGKGSCVGAPVAQVRSVLIRPDLEGDLVEVYVGSESGRFVWETLLDVARSLGGGPVGWEALRGWGWSA